MARIPLGALTTLNLSTHLDPMFVELYTMFTGFSTGAFSATTISGTNLTYSGTFTGSAGVINIGTGQIYKDASGNFGIGVTPGAKLDVAGNVRVSGEVAISGSDFIYSWAGGASGERRAGFYLDGTNQVVRGYTAGAERMRMDAAGNLGVGSAPNNHGAGSVNMTVNATAASVYDLNLNGVRNCTWSLVDTQAQIGTLVSKPFILMSNNVERVRFETSGHVSAGVDNAQTLGTAAKRWSVVYAGTGSINTSDAREKTPITELSQAEIAAAKEIAREIGTFQMLASVAANGDAARLHIGMTVQRAIEIMQGYGLEPFRYAFICYDSWPGDGGSPGGDRYSFRTDELALFLARGFEARLAELESS